MQYEKLDIWLRSKNLAIDVYRELAGLRDFGFKDQITRSALSVPSNIAEGMERSSNTEKARFLVISKGSTGEFKTQTDIGVAIGYINQQRGLYWMNEAEQLSKMLGSFIKRLKNND
ncbi:MAG: four helix bundle protein [Colwellia sp.]|nr:four helix bundle protein [Colwellia sp.]